MQQTEIAVIVEKARQLVAEHYVFADLGARLGEALGRCAHEGRYAGVDNPAALATLVTEDLQSLNGDRHLRLKYHPAELADEDGGEVTLVWSREAARTMGGVASVERLAGNIGHLALRPILFSPSMAAEAIIAAMNLVARTEALVMDLRGCVGGDPATVALLCSYLFDEATELNAIYLREGDRTMQSWTLPYVPGPRFGGDKPIFVLTGPSTFSGGEALSYDLQQRGRATIVGERTGGGAHPRVGFKVHAHLEVTVPTGRPINPVSGTNWEGCGVAPDIEVPAEEAFTVAYRAALDHVSQLDGCSPTAVEAQQALDGLTEPAAVA
jgi:C-terminal processing protease CtpA/Prc